MPPPPLANPKPVVKNLALEGNPEQTEAIARQVQDQLRANNYDWKKVDRSLWSVPDEIHYQLWQPRTYHAWSRLTNFPVYHDEIAFYSNLDVWMEMKPSSGLEGKSLQLSGFTSSLGRTVKARGCRPMRYECFTVPAARG
jgi:hypothetical protein